MLHKLFSIFNFYPIWILYFLTFFSELYLKIFYIYFIFFSIFFYLLFKLLIFSFQIIIFRLKLPLLYSEFLNSLFITFSEIFKCCLTSTFIIVFSFKNKFKIIISVFNHLPKLTLVLNIVFDSFLFKTLEQILFGILFVFIIYFITDSYDFLHPYLIDGILRECYIFLRSSSFFSNL